MADLPTADSRAEHLDALWTRLETALELSTSNRVLDHLEQIARLCEEAAQIARVDLATFR